MASVGLTPGDFATFRGLDGPTRRLVLRLLTDHPSEQDYLELESHPASKSLAQWLLTLPAYRRASPDDEEA
jgi:hypothetical protein